MSAAARAVSAVGRVFDPPFENLEAHEGGSKTRPTPSLRLIVTLAALFAAAAAARAEVLIERTWLPHDASPSSFALGLPGGINFCFDPVRCSVSYAWTGGFLDLAPVRPGPGKFISPAKLLGAVAYRETGAAPLRRGDPTRAPVVEFSGYTLREDAVEFRYTVDGVPVRETIRGRADGTGLARRFQIQGGADAKWWHVADGQPPAELARGANGGFVLEVNFEKGAK